MNKQPAIGRTYGVPCVYGEVHSMVRWWPIFGPEHGDAELGVPTPHWHFDFRFLSAAQFGFLRELANGAGYEYAFVVYRRDANGRQLVSRGPELRKRKCLRHWPEYPAAAAGVKVIREKLARFQSAKLTCLLCPHRGFDLSQVDPGPDGVITCPGHGLRWYAATGEPAP